jgi:hypothetical protein
LGATSETIIKVDKQRGREAARGCGFRQNDEGGTLIVKLWRQNLINDLSLDSASLIIDR